MLRNLEALNSCLGSAPLGSRDVPLAKNPSMGTAQQRLFLVLKVVLYVVVVISEVLRLNTKSRCSRCCRAHLCLGGNGLPVEVGALWIQVPCHRLQCGGLHYSV